MKRERVIDRELHQVTEFPSVESFLNVNLVPAGINTVFAGGLPIDMLMSPRSSDTTIFFFHGAIESHFNLPVLSGIGVSSELDVNRVFISDPTLLLDKDLTLAWYAGNHHQPHLQRSLQLILTKIAQSLGSEKLIFFGGSGGGFASLYFASQFEESLALVFNPQTDIEAYRKRAVQHYVERAFHNDGQGKRREGGLPESIVSDLCELYATPNRVSVAYMQNLNDTLHVERHLKPFVSRVHRDTSLLVLADRWQQGHSPPSKELLSQVLRVVAKSDNWARDLERLNFRDMRSGDRSIVRPNGAEQLLLE